MDQLAHLTLIELSLKEGTTAAAPRVPPTQVRIFPMGKVETSKGTFLFDRLAADAVMAAYADQGNELFFDYDHKSLRSEGPVDSGKAAGWFHLELRADGLWAIDIRWTQSAAAQLSAGEWRYFSPAFLVDDATGRIVELINVALTNNPATKNMTPLVAASTRGARAVALKDKTMSAVPVTLGLAASATEAEQLNAITPLVELSASVRELTGKTDASEALAVLSAWRESHAKLDAAQVELSALRSENERRETDRLIRLGREQTKVTDANESKVRALGSSAAIAAFLETALPAAPANATREPVTDPAELSKSWDELTVAEKHRLSNDNPTLAKQLKGAASKKR